MKALITGASSGIGRDIAINLSKKGYDLILVARDLEKLNEVKSKLHTNVEVVSMDVSNAENCKELHEKYQNIDILVNNAGFGDCGYFTKTSLDKELKMIDTVLHHVQHLFLNLFQFILHLNYDLLHFSMIGLAA